MCFAHCSICYLFLCSLFSVLWVLWNSQICLSAYWVEQVLLSKGILKFEHRHYYRHCHRHPAVISGLLINGIHVPIFRNARFPPGPAPPPHQRHARDPALAKLSKQERRELFEAQVKEQEEMEEYQRQQQHNEYIQQMHMMGMYGQHGWTMTGSYFTDFTFILFTKTYFFIF